MKIKREPTVVVQIFVAGDMKRIKECCQDYCDQVGLCVSVEETTFIYTDDSETGAAIRLVNYPRFPSIERDLMDCAEQLAKNLIKAAFQMSALVVGPTETRWLTERAEDQ